jgi:hypothetical protein
LNSFGLGELLAANSFSRQALLPRTSIGTRHPDDKGKVKKERGEREKGRRGESEKRRKEKVDRRQETGDNV